MKKVFITLVAAFLCLGARAQENDGFLTHVYMPVDAGISFSSMEGVGGAFYMRASLEYRFNIHKGLFILGELDTRTHPYKAGSLVYGNVQAGDAAYIDLLIGPGYRWALSDSFKLAFSLQGGASILSFKEVSEVTPEGKYTLSPVDKWYPAAKAGLMAEYYIDPAFCLFLAAGVPVTRIPVEPASMDPFVFFPTLSIGFNMALQ